MTFDLEPDPYVIERDDDGFFPSLKEANQDPLSKMYQEHEEKLSQLHEHYRNQPPFLNDDIRILKLQQDKYELKKLLNKNLEKITLPTERPHYGPGAIVPNSVLVRKDRIIFIGRFISYLFRLNYFGRIDNRKNANVKNGYHLFYPRNNYKHWKEISQR